MNKYTKQKQDNLVEELTCLIDDKSIKTGEHTRRTKSLVHMIAFGAIKRGMFGDILTKEYALIAESVAALHDIGKVQVPDEILNAPRTLTTEEFEEIKKHTTQGCEIVKSTLGKFLNDKYLKIALDTILYHHERYDGNGYPDSLKGEEIPLCARIMAIADVYDALVSERCYKEAFSKEEALAIIKKGSGTQFDSVLVGIFLEEIENADI